MAAADAAADAAAGEGTNNGTPRQEPDPPPSMLPLEPFRQLSIMSSLVAGWSALPSFTLLTTVYLNALYTRFSIFLAGLEEDLDPSPGEAAVSFGQLTVRLLLLLFIVRNMLSISWDFFVDSVRGTYKKRGGSSTGLHGMQGCLSEVFTRPEAVVKKGLGTSF